MQLRPMAMGEILDASFALLRRHAGVFFGVAIVCQGLPTGLSLYVQFTGGAPQHFWPYVASQLLSFIGYLLVTGASIRVVSQAYLGNEPSLSDALDFAFGKIGRTLAAGFASGILTGLAAILLIFPGIIVACGLSVAVQAAVLEPLPGGTDGLGRSWALTKGFRWRAFGLYVVVFVLLSLFLIGLASSPVWPRRFCPCCSCRRSSESGSSSCSFIRSRAVCSPCSTTTCACGRRRSISSC